MRNGASGFAYPIGPYGAIQTNPAAIMNRLSRNTAAFLPVHEEYKKYKVDRPPLPVS